MNRTFKEIPGYDCIRGNHPGCDGRDHGIAATEWSFTVSTDRASTGPRSALTLLMFTPFYPESANVRDGSFRCRNLAVCTTWPTSDSLIATGTEPGECPWLGKCYPGESWLGAGQKIADAHFLVSAGPEQPDTFWRALDDFLLAHIEPLIRFTDREQCSCCGGAGAVPKGAQ